MNHRRLLLLSGWLAMALGQAASLPERKPNIVVLLADDAGYHEFSMQGSPHYRTPRIDSIAANGVLFSQGYTSGTVCSPTRAGLLTGRYQNRFGHEYNIPPVYSEENGLSLGETTLADRLREAGYRTIALGKWHLGYAPKFHPLSRGFTDYYGFLQGARSYFPLEEPTRLNQLLRDREPVKEKFDYLTDELARAAAEYIDRHHREPFFLYLAFNATHGPRHALEADVAALPPGGPNPTLQAMTLALDRAVGVVLDALEEHELTRHTLVVFVNDNGGAQGHDNFPLRGRKGQTWEGGIRVPFAMQWPGVLPRGKVYTQPVITLDLFPTALAAAAVEVRPRQPLDGVDLIPFLTEQRQGVPHPVLFWKSGAGWAVREGDVKLVGDGSPRGRPALYNLAHDEGETTDLAVDQPETVARLRRLFDDWARDFPPTPWARGARGGEPTAR